MVEFNLEKALAGRKMITRSGIEVDQIALFPNNVLYPLVVHLKGYDSVYQVGSDGKVPPHSNFPYSFKERREYDLFLVPQKRTMFVNIYEGRSAGAFDTLEDANENADYNVLKLIARAVPIVVEE
jgi:hypothetical protein